MLISGKHEILSRSPFWLYKQGTLPSVATSARSYDVGEPTRSIGRDITPPTAQIAPDCRLG